MSSPAPRLPPAGRLGLRTVFMLSVAAVLITTSVLLGWLLIRDRARYLKADLETKGVSLARNLASNAEYGVLVGDREGLARLIQGLRHDVDLSWAAVIDNEGSQLASGPTEADTRWQLAAPSSAGETRSGEVDAGETGGHQSPEPEVQVSHLTSTAGTWVRIDAPVTTIPVSRSREEIGLSTGVPLPGNTPRERIGTVTLVLSQARLEAALSNARRVVGWVTLFVVSLGVLLAVPLAQFIVGPVRQLLTASHRIATGELGVRVRESSSRELADLARAFNQMAASLRERDQLLKDNAAELERRAETLRIRQSDLEAANNALVTLNQALRLSQEQLWASNAELLHTSRLKSAFLASMSHELRTPLNSIIGYTECMLDELDGPINSDQRDSLERVQRNGRHLLGLINDILDLSKIEAGRMELNLSEVSVRDLAEECVAMIRPLIRGKDIALTSDLEEVLPPLYADAARVRQVLINLLTNAVKFTERGEVRLEVRGTGDGLELAVHDTGRGIPENRLEEIFVEFRQLESPSAGGTGLGLAITRRLVELMSGTIQVRSQVGVGSTFTVWFPCEAGKPLTVDSRLA